MGVTDEIKRINDKVKESKAAVVEKGGHVLSSGINDLPSEIASIPMGDSLKIIDIGEIVFGSSFELTQEQGEALFNSFSVIKASSNDSGTVATYFLVKNGQVNNITIYSCAVLASGAALDMQIIFSDGKYTAYSAVKSIPTYNEVDAYPEEGLLVWNAREYGWVFKPKDEVIQESLPNYTKGDKPYTIEVSTELPTSDDKSKITFTY